MDRVGIDIIKNTYQQDLIENGKTAKAMELAGKELYEPIFTVLRVHPEAEPSINDMNNALVEIGMDMAILNREVAGAGTALDALMNNMKLRLAAVEERLCTEEERLKDINILCGNYNEFARVVALTSDYFEGNFSVENSKTFMAYATGLTPVAIDIMQVRGNGYEGNEYVYTNNKFLKETIDTSKQEFINDTSSITAYEYSRLTANSDEKLYPSAVNFDNEEAECSVTIGSVDYFNTVKVTSDIDSVIIKDVLTLSDDGTTFTSTITKPIQINNRNAVYESGEYAYGSGVICFPATKYLKITFRSNGATTDKIAFKNIDTTDAVNPKETIIVVDSAKRHIVRINDIAARTGTFTTQTVLTTGELVGSPVKNIAIFANEYVPGHFPSANYFKYVLTINGTSHEVTPINSQRSGIKIIKTSDYNQSDPTIKHVDESIKSASLSIVIIAPNKTETPYLSNVKVCFGEEELKGV